MNPTDCIYKPLNATNPEIRLLTIISTKDDSLVECRLMTVSLTDAPPFSALSYVWGDAEIRTNIILDGQGIAVTKNLEAVLRYLSQHLLIANPGRELSSFRLWVDAICINQENLKERNSQVQLMRQIYSSAELVLSWLGPEHRSLAFSAVNIIADEIKLCEADGALGFFKLDWLQRHPTLCDEGDRNSKSAIKNPSWAAISEFLKAPYWKRVWIFQEVVLAQRLILVGPDSCTLDWENLDMVWQRLWTLRDGLDKISMGKPGFLPQDVWSAITTPLLDISEIHRISSTRYKIKVSSNQNTVVGSKAEGWILSTFAGDLNATNPKDHIYGLLGISRIDVEPDYSIRKTVGDVYMEYVVGWLGATCQQRIHEDLYPLFFLSRAGIGLYGDSAEFPTWVPNFPEQARGSRSSTRVATGFADQEVFSSDGDTYPYVLAATKSLFVWGIEISPIASVSEAPKRETWSDGRMFEFIQSFVSRRSSYVSGIPPLQAVFRLVNRDSSSHVDKLVIIRALAFMRLLLWSINEHGMEIINRRLHLLGFVRGACDEEFIELLFPGTDIQQFGFDSNLALYLCQGVDGPIAEVWDRTVLNLLKIHLSWRFFETGSGHLGIAPVGIQAGDLLCVLKNCDVPVVMRRVPDTEHYILIGTAFVVGLMNGEAVSFVRSGRSTPQWFELR